MRLDHKQRSERGIDGITRPQLHACSIDSFSSQKFHPFAETGVSSGFLGCRGLLRRRGLEDVYNKLPLVMCMKRTKRDRVRPSCSTGERWRCRHSRSGSRLAPPLDGY